MPTGPIDTDEQRAAVQRFAEDYLDGAQDYPALYDLIERRPPRADLGGDAVDAALSLSDSYLFVQGPPGSGKTHVGADMALALMQAGKRVGITAQSHRTIHNFLAKVEEVGTRAGTHLRGARSRQAGDQLPKSVRLHPQLLQERRPSRPGSATPSRHGVAVLEAGVRASPRRPFIDEGGQFSLADTIAVGTSAHNLILLGDPNQLAQVRQGAHPPGAGKSALEYLLGEDETVRPKMGIFLSHTWRLRPEICQFTSQAFYDGRLDQRSCMQPLDRRCEWPPVPRCRTRRQSPRSSQEADAIHAAIEALVGTNYSDNDGQRRLRHEDILVVAPFNAQVRLLRDRLPAQVRVGTVDKFQGQEGPHHLLLDGELKRRGRPARTRVPVLEEPAQRRYLARTVPRRVGGASSPPSRPPARRSSRCG